MQNTQVCVHSCRAVHAHAIPCILVQGRACLCRAVRVHAMLWPCCRAVQALHSLSCAAGSLDVASPSAQRLLYRSMHRCAPSAKSSTPGFPPPRAQSCCSQHGDLLRRVWRGKAPLQTNYPKTQRLRGKLPLTGSSKVHRVSHATAEIHISQLSLPSPASSLRVYFRTDGGADPSASIYWDFRGFALWMHR